ncbi:hypothetical protein BR1R3_47720 [Pseudomonas atacamensis]|jgi:hypothetical protein|uniref:hypothetical protein n=1 Tax=Pseudomonas atacamensis TaxID=2565368 RepID=UPI0022C5F1A5|nr:hypothetical protein [Pseudomonas atacamensis]GLH22030.1 hypothetical protein BR1R3_47720 [Pseudomonas atacamensis]
MTPYLVTEFQAETLSALIRECFGYEYLQIFDKEQVKYLYNYLCSLGAKSILLEPRYTDRDFLEDYSRYYLKRFRNDGQVCGRLHFFRCKLDHKSLDSMMIDSARQDLSRAWLQDNYLGFVVIKPLEKTFIGKTCLRIAGDRGTGPGTKKKIAKRYDVNLFGIKLHVNSIAFQEQDKVVSACATTAIWAALHALPGRNVKNVPSCSEITTAALNFVDGSHNGFPNKHLTHKQIQRSLDVQGLRYHSTTITTQTQKWFHSYASTHVDSDLPIILAGVVYGPENATAADKQIREADALEALEEMEGLDEAAREELKNEMKTSTGQPMCLKGGHAVTLVGYDFRDGKEWLYVHDDRLGPYARAKIAPAEEFIKAQADIGSVASDEVRELLSDRWALEFSQWDEKKQTWLPPHEILVPDLGIVPADKKARLDFKYAHGTAAILQNELERWMEGICQNSSLKIEKCSHTIKLASISQIRDEITGRPIGYAEGDKLEAGDESPVATAANIERWNAHKLSFLTTPMARLQWSIDLYWGERKVLKVLLDATDTPLGDAVSAIYEHDLLFADLFLRWFRDQKANAQYVDVEHFYSSFLKVLAKQDQDYANYLNTTYGKLRAPKRLEQSEITPEGKGANHTAIERFDPLAIERTLVQRFPDVIKNPKTKNLIWAIGKDGSLFVAEDLKDPKRGHPSMTGLQAARIAGEMWWEPSDEGSGEWAVNHCSGRYSFDYVNPQSLLNNAITKIASFFPDDTFAIEPVPLRRNG